MGEAKRAREAGPLIFQKKKTTLYASLDPWANVLHSIRRARSELVLSVSMHVFGRSLATIAPKRLIHTDTHTYTRAHTQTYEPSKFEC